MDKFENRRLALTNVVKARFDGVQARLAEKIEVRADYMSRMLNDGPNQKRISGDFARTIEEKVGLPPRWMDMPENAGSGAIVPSKASTLLPISRLMHAHAVARPDFIGISMYASDIERTGSSHENLRSVPVSDSGLVLVDQLKDYVAVIDVTATTLQDGDIYLFDHGNRLRLRHAILQGNQWVGRGDRQDSARYPDITIDAPEAQVIGKFVWGCGFAT